MLSSPVLSSLHQGHQRLVNFLSHLQRSALSIVDSTWHVYFKLDICLPLPVSFPLSFLPSLSNYTVLTASLQPLPFNKFQSCVLGVRFLLVM